MTDTITVRCPCGVDHSDHDAWEPLVDLIQKFGEEVTITIPHGSWRVPRVFIAMHGLKAWELVALADKYGWKKV